MSSKLIIVIENDNNLRQSLALVLQRAGYFVTATDCAFHAMDLLQSGRYQLVITDVNIPETQQVLLPQLMNKYPNMPVVVMTDHPIAETEKEDGQLVTHYLIKPIAPERLVDCVGTLIGTTQESNST